MTETPPARRPAIAETALACLALSRCPDAAAARAARRAPLAAWRGASTRRPCDRVDVDPAGTADAGAARGGARRSEPSAARRARVRGSVPGRPGGGPPCRSGGRRRCAARQAGRAARPRHRDRHALPVHRAVRLPALWAARLLVEHPAAGRQPVREAVARIAAARRDDSRIEDEPPATALALLALSAADAGSPAWRRCRAGLLRFQLHDGSWRSGWGSRGGLTSRLTPDSAEFTSTPATPVVASSPWDHDEGVTVCETSRSS